MASSCVARGPKWGLLRGLAFAFGILIFAGPTKVEAASIAISIDQAKLVKLPDRAATLVIGNPLIADASVQSGGLAIVTGKGYGATNMIALDASGAVLAEHNIEVRGPRDNVVVVYRGAARQTYSCMPDCEPRITLGDFEPYFAERLSQTANRNAQAQGITAGK
ncbi:MAG TPA: pilus assembly protein N-terminal domain-containing protein [Xanthobacteraceae bacterium]|jgi:Flp pilus assembly secretin CpaC